MPAVSRSQRRFFGMLDHNPAMAAKSGMSKSTLHEFASTPEKGLPERVSKDHFDDGSTGDYLEDGAHWMQGAVKRPGALTKKATSAGETPMAFARQHYHASGRTGEQARFAVNAQKRR